MSFLHLNIQSLLPKLDISQLNMVVTIYCLVRKHGRTPKIRMILQNLLNIKDLFAEIGKGVEKGDELLFM